MIHTVENWNERLKKDSDDPLTRKWTSNHPPNPQSLVFSKVIDDRKSDLTLRMSFTVAVKQSISFIMAAVPMTWCGWRFCHNDVCRNYLVCSLKLQRMVKKNGYFSYRMETKELDSFLYFLYNWQLRWNIPIHNNLSIHGNMWLMIWCSIDDSHMLHAEL